MARYVNWRTESVSSSSVFFYSAGRLVSVPDREPREEEREAEERRRFLAASLLSSAALWAAWSRHELSSVSTVRSSTRGERRSRNDKQLRPWSRSQEMTSSTLNSLELLRNLLDRSWKFPNTTIKTPERILQRNEKWHNFFVGWKLMNESEFWLSFVCWIQTQTHNKVDLNVLKLFFQPNLIPWTHSVNIKNKTYEIKFFCRVFAYFTNVV